MRTALYTGILEMQIQRDEVVRLVAEADYEGIEWQVRDSNAYLTPDEIEKDAEGIAALCGRHGLSLPNLVCYYPLSDTENIARTMRVAQRMGCPSLMVWHPKYQKEVGYAKLLEGARRDIEKLLPFAARYGVYLVMETFPGTIAPSPSLAYRMVEGFPPEHVKIIFEPTSMMAEGRENWRTSIDILQSYLAPIIYVKDNIWCRDESGRWSWQSVPLGHGMMPWDDILRALRNSGWDGWLSTVDYHRGPVEPKIKSNNDFMSKLIERVEERNG